MIEGYPGGGDLSLTLYALQFFHMNTCEAYALPWYLSLFFHEKFYGVMF